MYQRPIYHDIKKRLEEPRRFMQVLLGPRQVGKTTLALSVGEALAVPFHYASADSAILNENAWLTTQWEIAREKAKTQQEALLILDEIQKIPHWSDTVKALWDEDTRLHTPIKVMILGSSPWLLQKGLTESLAGRFETIYINHWSYSEMQACFQWDLDQYIYFGGYPGAAILVGEPDRWKNYVLDALIETSISRDILLMVQVNKPALLKRLFQLGCLYSGQILSFQKILGQLTDAGNTTTLSHYLNLLNDATLLSGITKFAAQPFRQRNASPRFMVYNTALISAQMDYSFDEALNHPEHWGHLVESAVGAHLLNSIRGTSIQLFYWREGHQEVDFILKKGELIIAIEVKSGKTKFALSGLDAFSKAFHPKKSLIVGKTGIPLETFLSHPAEDWI